MWVHGEGIGDCVAVGASAAAEEDLPVVASSLLPNGDKAWGVVGYSVVDFDGGTMYADEALMWPDWDEDAEFVVVGCSRLVPYLEPAKDSV